MSEKNAPRERTRLYLISPPRFALAEFKAQLEEALVGGDVGAFQLRMKDASDAEIETAAKTLLPICRARDVAFIMNDRVDLTRTLGLDGVHLGQEDLEKTPVAKARELLGQEAVIGVSCHASKHLGMVAGDAGADYVAFGAFYPTTSKPMEKLEKWGTPTPEILSWWSTYTVLPAVAIGGMTPANCATLVAAGADFIAAITAVWNHPQGSRQAVLEFNRAIDAAFNTKG